MTERAELMRIYRSNGISSISLMRDHYNSEDLSKENNSITQETLSQVNKSKANFVSRLKDSNRSTIKDWEDSGSVATHKLGYFTEDDRDIVYPEVQYIDGKLIDYTTPPYHPDAGINSAIQHRDTVSLPKGQGEIFTTHYKDVYPGFNKYPDGGELAPRDATFRATLINPVNSYRSNAPAGIGDAAITKATGLLNPITAATLTAAPLGAISKINAAAKAYKAAKIANPIIASTIGASSTSAGLAGYLDSRPDKKLSRDIENKDYLNYNLKVSLDAVRKDIINKYGYEAWDTMYPSLKRGLTDIRFNVGPNKEYPKATEAAIRNNIEQFMKEQKDGRSPRRVDSINTLFIDQLKNL